VDKESSRVSSLWLWGDYIQEYWMNNWTKPFEEVKMFPTERNGKVQDEFIEELKRKNATVTIFLTRGNRITGKIINHDKYTVLLEVEGEPNLIYKHAISTIVLGG